MSEMIEQVAKALEPMCFGKGNMPMMIARDFARVAIAAMRIPTERMQDAGERALNDAGVDNVSHFDASEAFTAMIDEALKAHPPTT